QHRGGGGRLVDHVDAPGEVPVVRARAAEWVAGRVDDRVVVDDVQPEGAVARARARGYGVGAATAADPGDDGARHTRGGEHEVGRIDAGDVLAEGDRPLDVRGTRGT